MFAEGSRSREVWRANRANGKNHQPNYDSNNFHGACIDSGAQTSVIGLHQMRAYCAYSMTKFQHKRTGIRYRFGDGYREGMGHIKIRIRVDNQRLFTVVADVVNADIPLLVGLDYLIRNGILLDFARFTMSSREKGWSIPLFKKAAHMFVEPSIDAIMFTRKELERLHLHFHHPSAKRLYKLLRRARPDETTSQTLRQLHEIGQKCTPCKVHSTRPYHFRVSIPLNDIIFNHELAMDLLWLEGIPVLHIVDTHTNIQNAIIPNGKSSLELWEAFMEGWSTIYVGNPNRVRVDRDKTFTSKEWTKLAEEGGISIQLSPIESHNSIGQGETYHHHLRRIFNILHTAKPATDPDLLLRYAIKGINDTMGENGLVPTQLVFGCMPSFPVTRLQTPKQKERMRLLRNARKEMATIVAERRKN